MKMDIETNYTVAQGLAPASISVGTDAGASIDHASGSCGLFCINCGAFGSGASITAKVQYSDDNSTFTDDDGSSGNDTSDSATAEGVILLNVPNPLGRYSRAYVTVATDAVVAGIVNILGPLRKIAPSS